MAHEQLDNLVRAGGLKVETATGEEVSGLIRSGAARLADAKNDDLSLDSRFDLAYNAAHALSLAALRIAGYRAENRYLVFQCRYRRRRGTPGGLIPRRRNRASVTEPSGVPVIPAKPETVRRIATTRRSGGREGRESPMAARSCPERWRELPPASGR